MVKANWWHDYILIAEDLSGSPGLALDRSFSLPCPQQAEEGKSTKLGAGQVLPLQFAIGPWSGHFPVSYFCICIRKVKETA